MLLTLQKPDKIHRIYFLPVEHRSIITSYKLTINVSSYLQEYIQYPEDYVYNNLMLDAGLKVP